MSSFLFIFYIVANGRVGIQVLVSSYVKINSGSHYALWLGSILF